MKGKALSGIILTLLLTSMLTLALNIQSAKAVNTIYIRADGSIDPPTAPISTVDSITYTFTGNIYDSIVVERSNISIDGAGYLLQGAGSGNGFYLAYTNNVTTRNTNIRDFSYGIWVQSSHNNRIISNTITANVYDGIVLNSGSSNNISGNYVTGRSGIPYSRPFGIVLYSSSNNNIGGNNITLNSVGISFNPFSNYNHICGNKITDNVNGITLSSSSHNCISGNNITSGEGAFTLTNSPNCTISENTIIGGYHALFLSNSSGCNIAGNYIAGGYFGFTLSASSYCNVYGNNITSLVYIRSSSNNRIYHNNFLYGVQDVYVNGNSANVWDDGYPSGGNYWSDYTGVDEKSGPNQNQFASDGVGDTPCVINVQNVDHYPLMKPWIGIVTATVDIKPDTLNLKNKSKWVTAHIELSAAYSPADIDGSSIKLNDILQAGLSPIQIEDYDGDGILDLMVKFKTANLMPLLHVGINRITLTGKVNGMLFEDVDTIKVNA